MKLLYKILIGVGVMLAVVGAYVLYMWWRLQKDLRSGCVYLDDQDKCLLFANKSGNCSCSDTQIDGCVKAERNEWYDYSEMPCERVASV